MARIPEAELERLVWCHGFLRNVYRPMESLPDEGTRD